MLLKRIPAADAVEGARHLRRVHQQLVQIGVAREHVAILGRDLVGLEIGQAGHLQSSLPSVPAGLAFRRLQRHAAVHHQHLAGDVAGEIAQQEADGVADVPAGAFGLQHGRLGALGAAPACSCRGA